MQDPMQTFRTRKVIYISLFNISNPKPSVASLSSLCLLVWEAKKFFIPSWRENAGPTKPNAHTKTSAWFQKVTRQHQPRHWKEVPNIKSKVNSELFMLSRIDPKTQSPCESRNLHKISAAANKTYTSINKIVTQQSVTKIVAIPWTAPPMKAQFHRLRSSATNARGSNSNFGSRLRSISFSIPNKWFLPHSNPMHIILAPDINGINSWIRQQLHRNYTRLRPAPAPPRKDRSSSVVYLGFKNDRWRSSDSKHVKITDHHVWQ